MLICILKEKFVVIEVGGRSLLFISHYDRNNGRGTRSSESQFFFPTQKFKLIWFSYCNSFEVKASGGLCQGIDGLETALALARVSMIGEEFPQNFRVQVTCFCVSSL